VPLVRVVDQRDGHVQKIVELAVELLVEAVVGRFHHVAQDVDAVLPRQRNRRSICLKCGREI